MVKKILTKKNSIQDITPQHHRSIQDISMADVGREDSSKHSTKKAISSKGTSHKRVEIDSNTPTASRGDYFNLNSRNSLYVNKPRFLVVGLLFFGILSLIASFVFVFSFFHSAIIYLNAKELIQNIDNTLAMDRADNSSGLPFEIVSLSDEAREFVPSNGEKTVSTKSTGKVLIYNKNTTAQKLVAQTRFETQSGKIYRLTTSVVVPPAKKTLPGSIEANIVADAPGPEYNSSLVDLTLPGFKGTAKYESIYARSKTPFSGGESGVVKVADEEGLLKARSSVKESLDKQLLNSASQQIPDSFLLLPNLYVVHYASSTQETKDNVLTLKQSADFVGVLVDVKKISMYLAKKTISGYSGEDVLIDNLKDLEFNFATSTYKLGINTNNISVKIKGKAHFVYQYNADSLKADLAGVSRESFATIIATYPGIEKGNSTIKPFWRTKFPTELDKIIINEEV